MGSPALRSWQHALMDTTPLRVFATKARASNRLLYGDLRRLQRDVLPTGATSREEVEVLLTLDSIERVNRDWPRYLAMTVSEFVLSTADPPGVIERGSSGVARSGSCGDEAEDGGRRSPLHHERSASGR